MSEDFAPFIKWGNYKSTDKNNPDILKLRALETETFETEYGTNAEVQLHDGTKLSDAVLVLKSHASTNASLLNAWTRAVKDGKIKAGTIFVLKTWLGTSKNKHPIRRFKLVIS
jgi:hypothetical protein